MFTLWIWVNHQNKGVCTRLACEIASSANLCNLVLNLEKEVCFVGLINSNGRLVEQSKRKNRSLDNPEKIDWTMLCMQTRLHTSMQGDHDENFGRFGYCITEREKTTMMTIPTIHGTMLVISSNKIDSKKLAKQIFRIVGDDCFATIPN